jgi:hypothetical protein
LAVGPDFRHRYPEGVVLTAAALALLALADASWLTVDRDRGAETCPDASTLAAAVRADLGRAAGPESFRSSVHCQLGRQGPDWIARIEIGGGGAPPAVRLIRAAGADCRPLSSALALTLALALSGSGPPRPVRQQVDGELSPALSARPPPVERRSSLSAGAVLSAGALLEVSTGIELGARRRFHDLVLGVEGRLERALPARHGPATLEGWRATGALVPCLAPGRGGLCAVARAGGFAASSSDIAAGRAGRGAIAELGARATWQLGAGSLALAFYVEGTVPVVRTSLLVDGRPVWASPAAAASVGAAVSTWR